MDRLTELIDKQLQDVLRRYDATLLRFPHDANVVMIDGMRAEPGVYNRDHVTAFFSIPCSYPCVAPYGFWTDKEFRMNSGAYPTLTVLDSPYWSVDQRLFWRWKVQRWDPPSCTLYTYVKVIEQRLWLRDH